MIDKKTKLIVNLSVFIITLNCFFSNLGVYSYRTSPPLLVSSLILTFFAIFLHKKEQAIGNISKYVFITFLIIGLSYGIAGVLFFVPTYIMNGYIFALQLPLLYICMKFCIIEQLVAVYCKSYVAISTIIILFFMLIAPLNSGQYNGIFNNPNLTGEFLSCLAICTLYIFEKESLRGIKIANLAIFGISTSLIFFTRSRTSILACVFLLFAYLIYAIRERRITGKKLLSLILSIAIALPTTFFILNDVTPRMCEVIDINIDYFGINDSNHSANSFKDAIGDSADRLLKGVNNDSSFSSGRFEIWQAYINRISIKPHRPDLVSFEYNGHVLKANSHNSFLQVAYQSGIISGAAFLFLYIFIGLCALRSLLKDKLNFNDLFAIMTLANSVPYVLLSNTVGPYTAFSLLSFWIIVIPYYINKKRRKESTNLKRY